MEFSSNLSLLIRERRVVRQNVLAKKIYGLGDCTRQRRIRRLINGVVRPTLDDVINYASVLGVNASELAFGSDGVFTPYVDVQNRFRANMRLFKTKYTSESLAQMLYPYKKIIDYNDVRKLDRLISGYTRPKLDDIQNLADGLGVHPGKLSFGVL
tara:strand:+ start:783 stop:1247 length:465 start_codon:yes stop_codon:yes gene_type:complete